MIFPGDGFLIVVLVAIVIDAVVGDPDWIWRRISHPVVWFGAAISFFEKRLNSPTDNSASKGRFLGAFTIVFLVILGRIIAYWVEVALLSLGVGGYLILAIIASTLLAQNSLYLHVQAVAHPLENNDIDAAKLAVSMIVGRDPDALDKSGVARAAIESLAENFSDGIVAPVFWFALFGFPGLVIYKLVNTADSMIGHKNDRYMHFGWASARLDDVLNFTPARLTMLLLLLAPRRSKTTEPSRELRDVWRVVKADAPRHRSPNAGWPEAAMAGRLGIALSGPRHYGEQLVDEPYVNDHGKRDIGADQIRDALGLYGASCAVMSAIVALGAVLTL